MIPSPYLRNLTLTILYTGCPKTKIRKKNAKQEPHLKTFFQKKDFYAKCRQNYVTELDTLCKQNAYDLQELCIAQSQIRNTTTMGLGWYIFVP